MAAAWWALPHEGLKTGQEVSQKEKTPPLSQERQNMKPDKLPWGWRDDARASTQWKIEKAKRLFKSGARSLPLEMETFLQERGVDIKALKSKYQN